ncbi:MAG: DUF952 domain-containing protein [Acidobacteria bacterium]|nr:MAG: DUF952 domain-containing protein [Acidobacteriota bacterium]REK03067.1 MAG: DUF952 domain-containing protein [Acidobacteriota bacterium]REK13129.1 MAG: DUF952 domain-containing protein [Acidobacteriota bacterium]REK41123.1 MAG: DUF952 domain-containing protein [Acidobacteriota bacterium]
MSIYHIVDPETWEALEDSEPYAAGSLETEGFIHCSFKHQLAGVLERYYKGSGRLVILEIDPERLDVELVTEPSTGGEEYPHIYGKINKEAVCGTMNVLAPEDD